jgi:hypothetical protein
MVGPSSVIGIRVLHHARVLREPAAVRFVDQVEAEITASERRLGLWTATPNSFQAESGCNGWLRQTRDA